MALTELFKKVQKVDAPPFLLTRIQARLQALETMPAPVSWQWAGASALLLLLWLNINTVQSANAGNVGQHQPNAVVGAMQLDPNPQLYAESN